MITRVLYARQSNIFSINPSTVLAMPRITPGRVLPSICPDYNNTEMLTAATELYAAAGFVPSIKCMSTEKFGMSNHSCGYDNSGAVGTALLSVSYNQTTSHRVSTSRVHELDGGATCPSGTPESANVR